MSHLFQMFYETLFGVTGLFILTKVIGKTQISQLSAFDFISAVILGELVGNALFDKNSGILEIGFVITTWGVILYTIEIITQKFKRSRFIIEGKPSMIIHKGQLVYEEMRKNKIDIDEIQQLLRGKDVFSIQDVEYAILETNGDLSVLKKAPLQTPSKEDLNLPLSKPEIAVTLINDGEIIYDNLEELHLTEDWLLEELKRHRIENVKQVFYAEYLEGKPLHIQPYNKIKHETFEKKLHDK